MFRVVWPIFKAFERAVVGGGEGGVVDCALEV